MGNDEIFRSIGTLMVAIDQKLEKMLENQDNAQDKALEEIKSFFERLATIVSTQFIGDLPQALGLLEKKINLFDHDLKDFLREFSDVLIKYESKVEERIKDEVQALQEQFFNRLDHHQREQTTKLEEICLAINNLAAAISKLRNTINDFNSTRFDPALSRLEEILQRYGNQEEKPRLFGRRKK